MFDFQRNPNKIQASPIYRPEMDVHMRRTNGQQRLRGETR